MSEASNSEVSNSQAPGHQNFDNRELSGIANAATVANDATAKLADQSVKRKSPIRFTPLIDVVFILLIFFMLVSNFTSWQTISLDTRSSSESLSIKQKPLVVQVRGDELLLAEQPVSLPRLLDKTATQQAPQQPISLQPLGQTSVQQMIVVLEALAAAGLGPLNLIDDPAWQGMAELEAKTDAIP